jgi:amino acid transporter
MLASFFKFTAIRSLFKPTADGKFGTIKGVYIPDVLQMIGVILFLRLGWILGHVGIVAMSFIILLSSTLILLTSLSMTTIVSNMKMRGGGSYYIISRCLGLEFGSAIGILQCISQLCSVALCVTGFALSVHEILPSVPLPLLKAATLSILICLSYWSTDLALKTQIFIFTVLLIAISGIFWGWSGVPDTLPLLEPSNHSFTFWMAFAMFFPATTGIESGMAMSGDLRNPARSLPIGTIIAVLTVFCLYLSIALFLSFHASSEYLQSYPFLLYHTNHFKFLILLGIWAATLSSALGAILGGPRVMQAIAKDGILPKFLAKGYGPTNQPRVATLCMLIISMGLLLFAEINQIIPIMTMACLVSYGLINFIAFMETIIKNPSWRPYLKIPFIFPMMGCIGCFSAMFLINSGATFIISILLVALCCWTSSRKITSNWDDIRYGIYSYFIHKGTVKLSNVEKSAKNWRPHILALFDTPHIQKNLAFFAHALNQEKGFLTFGAVLKEPEEDLDTKLKVHLKELKIPSHIHVNTLHEPIIAADQMIKNYGFGHLKPNTIFFSIPSNFPTLDFVRLLMSISSQKKNIVLLKDDPHKDSIYGDASKQKKQIHLWWRGKYPGNFEFSLALAFLLQQSKLWPISKISIKMMAKDEQTRKKLLRQFEIYRPRLRIKNLEFDPLLNAESDFFSNLIQESKKTDLTFLGLKRPNQNTRVEEYAEYYLKLMESTREISNVAYVLSGEQVQFRKIFL